MHVAHEIGPKPQSAKAQSEITIPLDESLKILSFEPDTEITSEMLSERYYDYIARNSPEKEGSVYLTAKIENAKDAIAAHYGLTLLEQESAKNDTTQAAEDA